MALRTLVVETVAADVDVAAFVVGVESSVLLSATEGKPAGESPADKRTSEATRAGSGGASSSRVAGASGIDCVGLLVSCCCASCGGCCGSSTPSAGLEASTVAVFWARHCTTWSSDVVSSTCLLQMGHWTKLDPPPTAAATGARHAAAGQAAGPAWLRFCFLFGGASRPHSVV